MFLKINKVLKIFLGSLIIALTINLFFINLNFIPSGMFGFGIIFSKQMNVEPSLVLALINMFFLLLASTIVKKRIIRKCLITFWLIPLLVFITKNVPNLIDITSADKFLLSIYGGFLMGIGYRFIYRENALTSSTDLINIIEDNILYEKENIIVTLLNIVWLFITYICFGLENALYSLISIIIMENISKRINIGVSESKVFYIITSEEARVRDYILNELNYNLTVLEVKGGFTGNKNRVIMCVVQTYDYFRLREGVKYIDPNAFISITDSYEAINGSHKGSKNNSHSFHQKLTKS